MIRLAAAYAAGRAISDNLDKYHNILFKQRYRIKRFADLEQAGPSAGRLSAPGIYPGHRDGSARQAGFC
jgi:hypothetical protein